VIDLAGNSAASTATVTVEVIIPEFPSSVMVTVLLVLVSAFSLAFRKKMKLGKT